MMFSVVCVCQSVHRGSHVTIAYLEKLAHLETPQPLQISFLGEAGSWPLTERPSCYNIFSLMCNWMVVIMRKSTSKF